ncbi:AraC family transcriptional regulator [Zestomonas carbonaria]|uniref:RCS-specific HTH-type transcriptional activator RclR n=1 Tax=Zestomonas carbonaria TaxID=2762745 RepID=A0A7U7I9T2_9GAMM|nr:AraC family transcriptional regulator [Pseudomonas carbonaria]CAD5108625.1 RCS-specific HTH-type transcriptional activator RclR [Pseudomonas carbonaria]
MDRLSTLLAHFGMHAGTVHSGVFRGTFVDEGDQCGHVHLLRAGQATLSLGDGRETRVAGPTLILIPRPYRHRLTVSESDGAELVCATLRFDGGLDNPISVALPPCMLMPMDTIPMLGGTLEWLFSEAFTQNCGRDAIMNRLFELTMIQLLRHLMANHSLTTGMMAGLADLRLAQAMTLMHDRPGHAWTVAELADAANMSRASFAAHFRQVVGQTPADYLVGWRVSLAQKRLREGRPMALISDEVGYESPSALARAFRRKVGESPREWLQRQSA